MYQSVSESAEFCRTCDNNTFAYFFLGHSVHTGVKTEETFIILSVLVMFFMKQELHILFTDK